MAEAVRHGPPPEQPEPRWPTAVAVLAIGGLFLALPPSLSIGPGWLLLALIILLIVPLTITHQQGYHAINMVLGHLLNAIITLFLLASVWLLVRMLLAHKESPIALLQSAAALWLSNVLVFASWYWRLDAGGPHQRAKRAGHTAGAFLFPQMTLGQPVRDTDGRPWSPRFVDYLFLAFTTSTAFSPTDTPVLSRWAKALTMVQAIISLAITIILVARAINIA
ncbi:MAG: hypothetical protein ACM359_18210 [Bacillota bacterium]